jgi:uncharacterized lipoprotein YddW (UPF0748 family)
MADKLKHWTWIGMEVDSSDDDWRRLFARLRAAGISAILPEVVSNSVAAYGSAHLPVRAAWLEQLLPIAAAAGLEVHAWMHTMPCNIPAVYQAHPEWYAVNGRGQSTADHPPYVGYYRFLCPSRPEVQQFLARRVRELAAYEGLASIHLDYIRFPDVILAEALQPKYKLKQDREYPEFDYCYCDVCRALFRAAGGEDPLHLPDPGADAAWRQFRCDRISHLVTQVLAPIARAAGKQVTAAVFPNWQHVRQEWHTWGLDAALPMLYHSFYNADLDWVGARCREEVDRLPPSVPLYSGLFVPALRPDQLGPALRISVANGARGVSLFAARSLQEEHWTALAAASAQPGTS